MGSATSHTKKDTAVVADLDEIKGTGFESEVDCLEELGGFINHVAMIWPPTTDLTCTITGGTQNAWGAWARLADSGGGYFDTMLTRHAHISSMNIDFESVADTIWILEIAYGVSHTVVARVRWTGTIVGIFAAIQQYRIRSSHIPPGSRVYARLMCSNVAAGQTARIHLRYYMHDA